MLEILWFCIVRVSEKFGDFVLSEKERQKMGLVVMEMDRLINCLGFMGNGLINYFDLRKMGFQRGIG